MIQDSKALKTILNGQERAVFAKLNAPAKIQDYLNKMPFNHEHRGETYMSPRRSLAAGTAHCFEGALIAAAALMYHGHKPLLMDLRTTRDDQDHVIALFTENGMWGAISKTNHNILRYRDPIFRDAREVALSYFNEYFMDDGVKTLRAYSSPFDLSKYSADDWLIAEHELVDLVNDLDDSRHIEIVDKAAIRRLRKADTIERMALVFEEWPKKTSASPAGKRKK